MEDASPAQSPRSPWSDPAMVLASHQLEQVDQLKRDLAACESDAEKTTICRRTRDSLLGENHNLEILFAFCRDVMEASERNCNSEKLDGPWRQFAQLADKGSKLRAARVKTLRKVADGWGSDVVHHYGWGTIGHSYCQQLHAAARQMDWPTFVRRLNQALLGRHWAKSLNVPSIPALVNPITVADIEKARGQSQPAKRRCANGPVTEEDQEAGYKAAKTESESRYRAANRLPPDLGLDRFGILVRKEFDEPPENPNSTVTTYSPAPGQNLASPPPSAATGTAFVIHSIGCIEPLSPELSRPSLREPPRSLPAQPPAEAGLAGREAMPLPPSPPSSPNSRASTSLSTAEPERAFFSRDTCCKRAACAPLGRATKRHRTHPHLPWVGDLSATISPPRTRSHSNRSARSDAKEILDLLTRLQTQGSPLIDRPEFDHFKRWAEIEHTQIERGTSIVTRHPSYSTAITVTRRPAPSFLDQVLLPPTAGQDCGPSQEASHREQGKTEQQSQLPVDVSNGTPDASLLSTSFIIKKEQAIVALESQDAKEFMVVTLDVALDHNGGIGSFITFTIPEAAAHRLATCQGDTLEDAVAFSRPASAIPVTREGVLAALNQLSSSCLNIPAHPNLPFVTLWVPQDIGKQIAIDYRTAS